VDYRDENLENIISDLYSNSGDADNFENELKSYEPLWKESEIGRILSEISQKT